MSDSLRANSHPLPLRGVRVLDLTRVLAGPYCTMLLADLGADVVKIEHPDGGDDSRRFGPFLPSGLSAYFGSVNRGKRSVCLDLKREDDRASFLRLVERADVVVENYRAGTMRKLGLADAELRRINPRLVFASLSGFGQMGTNTDRPAYDLIVQALSGLMSITGNGPGEFTRVGTSVSDILTGMFGAVAVIAALRHRDLTGSGSTVDLAMLDCTVAALENAVSRFTVNGEVPYPLGTRHPSITPFQGFSTADGMIVVAVGNDSLWRKLCAVLEWPELLDDSRFATNASRTEHRPVVEELLNSRFARHPQQYWLDQLTAAGVPAAPIRNLAEVLADPHLASRQMWHEMRDGADGTFLTAGSPLRMNGQSPPLSDRVPELGEHTQAVLDEWLRSE
jgi:CoA:oxalate CoA-transferase